MISTSFYTEVLFFITELFFLFFIFRRSLIYLRFFQQEEYDGKRFFSWLVKYSAFDKRGSWAIILAFFAYFSLRSDVVALTVLSLLFTYYAIKQTDPRTSGKIKLNMTMRARRIYFVAVVLFLLSFILLCFPCINCSDVPTAAFERRLVSHFVLIQFVPFFLIASNILLAPFEKATKEKYKNQAKSILKQYNPFVIGITGSYGKTSVKAALGEVLNTTLAPTFCPPKSINTEMGITREIRENMKPGQKYAVIEMGAYNVGSIERLCKLTPPNAGLVTVVGMAHLERYGTVERIYHAKSELAKAVPEEGILVCNGDNEGARRMAKEFPKKTTLLYGMKPENGHLDCKVSDISYTHEGTEFKIDWREKTYKGFTKLHGISALSNLIGVFTMACALGADPEFVLATIRNIKPVDNRLSLSKEGEVHFIRDAYNSNPLGFEAALDVLSKLPAKRRILMTPGMIELGHEQENENRKAAFAASKVCDLVIIVGDTNKAALHKGLQEGGFDTSKIIFCDTRTKAFEVLNKNIQAGDLILLENDLPDLYEMEERF